MDGFCVAFVTVAFCRTEGAIRGFCLLPIRSICGIYLLSNTEENTKKVSLIQGTVQTTNVEGEEGAEVGGRETMR